MTFQEAWNLCWQQIRDTDALQWIAVALGIAEVLLAKANKIWLYPTGIASTLLSIYILFIAGLYAESLLNIYYVVMSCYGWWIWIKKKGFPPLPISYSDRKDWIIVSGIATGGFIMMAFLLSRYTPSTVPLWDALVSSTAWAGMWLLAKRKIENWILLNISNAFAIPLLFYKQLPLYALLTVFLFVVAVFGFYEWKKIYTNETKFIVN